jgi:tetratricopeptide (TPR) repeat protein
MRLVGRQHDAAAAEFKEAIALDPADSLGYALMGFTLAAADRAAEGLPHLDTAMRLDPLYPPWFDTYLAFVLFGLERYAEAATALESATQRYADDEYAFVLLAATYGQLGRTADAADAVAKANALFVARGDAPFDLNSGPGFSLKRGGDGARRYYDGLARAGVPEFLSSGDNGDWGSATVPGLVYEVRIEDDQLCYAAAGSALCGEVFRNPGGTKVKENEFIWYRHNQALTFSPVD